MGFICNTDEINNKIKASNVWIKDLRVYFSFL